METSPVTPPSLPAESGALPAWQVRDLPEPLPLTWRNALRTVGPGAILLAGAIGGGEWIAGPLMAINYGREILWIATVAILLQLIFNLEAIRYTLYTGEPILTGIMRLAPGSKFWGICYSILALFQLGVPSLGSACASVIFAAAIGEIPSAEHQLILRAITICVVLVTFLLLLSGKTVEKVLEIASWFMVIAIFIFLVLVNVLLVPAAESLRTLAGFWQFGHWPASMDLGLLAVFAATAGSGGIGNLVISNWFRDKGYAMGAYSGSIGGWRGSHKTLTSVGSIFVLTERNLERWRSWWTYVWLDQGVLWAGGCFLGMYLNVNLAAAIIPQGTQLEGVAAGTYQAHYLAQNVSSIFWSITLLNGFWILFSTHLSNTDGLVRTVCDITWVAFPEVQRHTASRVYAMLLTAFTMWAMFSANWGTALQLFKILGIVAAPIMALGAWQIWRVNRRFLPKALRPAWWQLAGLAACGVFYAVMFLFTLWSIVWRHQVQ